MARSYSLSKKNYSLFLYGITLTIFIAVFAPATNAAAQEVNKMGLSASERNSTRVNLPNIMNKQDHKGPYMNHLQVSIQNEPQDILEQGKKAVEAAKGVVQEAEEEIAEKKKEGAEPQKASSDTEEKQKDQKEAAHEPSELNKRLERMGINADSMSNAVFLRHMIVSTTTESK